MWGSEARRSVWFKPLALAALFGAPVPLYAAVHWERITGPAVAAACPVRIAGYRVDPSTPAAPDAPVPSDPLSRLSRNYLGATVHINVGQHGIRASRATLGASIDGAHLQALLSAAADPSSALRLVHDQFHRGQPLHVPMPITLDGKAARTHLLRLKDRIDRPPSPPDPDLAAPGKPGRTLHMMRTLQRLQHALRHGERTIEPVVLDLPFKANALAP